MVQSNIQMVQTTVDAYQCWLNVWAGALEGVDSAVPINSDCDTHLTFQVTLPQQLRGFRRWPSIKTTLAQCLVFAALSMKLNPRTADVDPLKPNASLKHLI